MISNFFTETATIKRLSTATKTKRLYEVGSIFKVSEPQAQNELDLIAGIHVTKHNVYTYLDSDVSSQDQIEINSVAYTVLEVMSEKVRNLEYKILLCMKNNE